MKAVQQLLSMPSCWRSLQRLVLLLYFLLETQLRSPIQIPVVNWLLRWPVANSKRTQTVLANPIARAASKTPRIKSNPREKNSSRSYGKAFALYQYQPFNIAMFQSIKSRSVKFINDESGPTAVEYAIMLALIMAVCITAIGAMGLATADSWSDSSTKMDSFMNGN